MRSWMIFVGLSFVLEACNATDNPKPDGGIGGRNGSGSAGTAARGSAGSASAGKGGSGGSCTPCFDTLSWGFNGGFVAFTDESSLTDCNAYQHMRTTNSDPGQNETASCKRSLPCMGSGLHGVADVLQALSEPDVQAALDEGTILFGNDPRAFDGSVFRISTGESSIEIGTDCEGTSDCIKVPTSVTALADLLQSIDDEQLHLDPCAGQFK